MIERYFPERIRRSAPHTQFDCDLWGFFADNEEHSEDRFLTRVCDSRSAEVEVVMENTEFFELMSQWANTILVWIGFGTVVGLLAKAIMPGRDPGGAIATMAMGIGGTVIGCGILAFFHDGHRVTPISPLGFAVATGGAFIILLFYKILGGYWFTEGEHVTQYHARTRGRGRRRSRGRRVRDASLLDD